MQTSLPCITWPQQGRNILRIVTVELKLHRQCGFDAAVERVARRHVVEMTAVRADDAPSPAEHDYFEKLGAGGIAVGTESVVRMAADDTDAVQVRDSLVEVAVRVEVAEAQLKGITVGEPVRISILVAMGVGLGVPHYW